MIGDGVKSIHVRPYLKARPYLRVSQDASGRERSPDEQFDVIAASAEANGWTLVTPDYRDTTSASRYSTKAREGFDRLVADLQTGRFGADLLLLWESSRGSRRVSEWLQLIELCEDRNIRIHVHLHHRTYDPANARDRRSLLEDAVDSEYEVAKTSERVRRAAAANAVAGRPHGRCPFGYARNYGMRGAAKLIEQVIEPAEAAVVRELFDRTEAGHSLHGIARDFAARGITTRTGRTWTAQHLRKLLRNPTYAGWRTHNGERSEAIWPQIIKRRQFLAVQRILDDPERVTRRPGRGKHLLSGTVVCHECGGRLRVLYPRRKDGKAAGRYTCAGNNIPGDGSGTGHVAIDKAELDELIFDLVVGYLSDKRNYSSFIAQPDDAELERIAEELAEARAEWDALSDSGISVELAAKKEPKIRARITELEQRDADLRTPSQLAGLLGAGSPGDDIAARLENAPLAAQRTAMRLVLVPERLGQARVQRSRERGLRTPADERVVLRRTTGDVDLADVLAELAQQESTA